MNKTVLLRAVNAALACSFVVQAATGVIFFFRVKAPHMDLILEAHEYNGMALVALVAVHLALNWGWVRANIFPRRPATPVDK